MRIVIDMQGAQTQSRHRGIGRYTLSLAKAMVLNCGQHEIILALNGIFGETIAPIRTAFQDILPRDNIRVWYAPTPVSHLNADNDWRRQSAELTREAFLASLNPSVVLVSSMFEGFNEDAVTSIGELSQTIPTAVILYDLILLIHGGHYLANPAVKNWFERKLVNFRRADLILSISESARQEGLDHLGIQPNGIVNISSAADAQFRPHSLNPNEQADLRNRYGLRRSIVMYTGGIEHRKNVEALIRSYALLPPFLRQTHQLAIVCAVQASDRARLDALARSHGLAQDELVMTGYVSDADLLALYNLCTIFVFPSWHEGFGLPVLEAMACGKAVLGANTSSLPEVIGREDALFDPFDDSSIKTRLERALVDDAFRGSLEQHGLLQAQKFSWKRSAETALRALDDFVAAHKEKSGPKNRLPRRPRLAYISPLPPDRSGISSYSAEMLPELAHHYHIDVIVPNNFVDAPLIDAVFSVRTVDWFKANANAFDRVLYHFGNSTFHQHMFSLLDAIPGVVVLHDFFLSGILAHMELSGSSPGAWTESLYSDHGYSAVKFRFEPDNITNAVMEYPCTQGILQKAQGVIVHSAYSKVLAQRWYGAQAGEDWACIPLMRSAKLTDANVRTSSRAALELGTGKFVVCSFGLLADTKCNHRLLDAWMASSLAACKDCMLIFVGEVSNEEYGRKLREVIRQSGLFEQIRITGWVDDETYRHYLASADVGVQLRTNSRGETSAAILDCMNYGLATIINSNGSMSELPDTITWKLPDDFTDTQLALALTELWSNSERRTYLGKEAQRHVHTQHAPRECAAQYFQAIERFSNASSTALPALVAAISRIDSEDPGAHSLRALAEAIDRSIPLGGQRKQLFLDVSGLVDRTLKNESPRAVRNILQALLLYPPDGFHVEPVYAVAGQLGYRYARQFTLELMDCPSHALIDEPIAFSAGDIFLRLGIQVTAFSLQNAFFEAIQRQGVVVKFLVHDLLPPEHPYHSPSDRSAVEAWLNTVAQFDGVVCVSQSTADELAHWQANRANPNESQFAIGRFHLGADFDVLPYREKQPENTRALAGGKTARFRFLVIGAGEPCKGHVQTLDAFDLLWKRGLDIELVMAGHQGQIAGDFKDTLRAHPEFGSRLYYLEEVGDEYLEQAYASSTCLIASSEGDGFGLSLIEAARCKLPILSRDIRVFREVAGEHAHYFKGTAPADLSQSIIDWLQLYEAGQHPKSDNLPWLTWEQSARQLLEQILPPRQSPKTRT